MREIKFRAWDTEWKRYVYDLKPFLEADTNVLDINNFKKYDGGYIIEQFTGLYDCNGKEIYEGDIVVIHNLTYEIVFVSGEFCGKALNISNPVSRCDAGNFQSCERIGNIHEAKQ